MYDNLLHCQDIALKNENFIRKFGSALEVLTKILKSFQFSSKTDKKSIRKLGQILQENLEGFFLPKRNTLTELEKLKDSYNIKPYRSLGTPVSELPPKAYIGKGYTDQGTAKEPAIDGSPSWQEVATKDIDGEFEDEKKSTSTPD